MARPRLLLIPSFTELEWTIRPALEEWADVASFDTPGVRGEALPFEVELDESRAPAMLMQCREGNARGDRRGDRAPDGRALSRHGSRQRDARGVGERPGIDGR